MRGPDTPLTARLKLRRQWRLTGTWGAAFVRGGVWLLLECAGRAAALQGGLQTAAVLVYGWTRWGRALALNHPPQEERLRPSLGAANWLSLLRGGLIAVPGRVCLPAGARQAPALRAGSPGRRRPSTSRPPSSISRMDCSRG